jgi:hypothetical protein
VDSRKILAPGVGLSIEQAIGLPLQTLFQVKGSLAEGEASEPPNKIKNRGVKPRPEKPRRTSDHDHRLLFGTQFLKKM